MNIKAWCPKCNWTGIAVVGRRLGLTIKDYVCPKCGNIVKRPYRGTYVWGAEKAHLREDKSEAKQ